MQPARSCWSESSTTFAASGRCWSPAMRPSASTASRRGGWRSHESSHLGAGATCLGGGAMRQYLADARALPREDLLPEGRARDTLPAMLLFVISVLVVFHFALPQNASERASLGLLWVAILFTALLGLGRAFVAEREQGVLDGLVLAPSDRSTIWVGKVISTLAFLVASELVALPAFALFFTSIDASTMAAAGRARELLLPLLFLPLAIPIVVGGVGASLSASSGKYLGFLALYDAIFVLVAWAAFEYVVTE